MLIEDINHVYQLIFVNDMHNEAILLTAQRILSRIIPKSHTVYLNTALKVNHNKPNQNVVKNLFKSNQTAVNNVVDDLRHLINEMVGMDVEKPKFHFKMKECREILQSLTHLDLITKNQLVAVEDHILKIMNGTNI